MLGTLDVPFDIDIATLYIPPKVGEEILAEIASKKVDTLWLNPGADNPSLVQRARELGLEPTMGCSLIAIGESPVLY